MRRELNPREIPLARCCCELPMHRPSAQRHSPDACGDPSLSSASKHSPRMALSHDLWVDSLFRTTSRPRTRRLNISGCGGSVGLARQSRATLRRSPANRSSANNWTGPDVRPDGTQRKRGHWLSFEGDRAPRQSVSRRREQCFHLRMARRSRGDDPKAFAAFRTCGGNAPKPGTSVQRAVAAQPMPLYSRTSASPRSRVAASHRSFNRCGRVGPEGPEPSWHPGPRRCKTGRPAAISDRLESASPISKPA